MAHDAHVKPRGGHSAPAPGSFSSLSKTLEDLEARLSRLSTRKAEDRGAAPAEPLTTSERLKALTAARRSARAELGAQASALAVEQGLRAQAPRPRRAEPVAASAPRPEVEAVRRQNSTVEMMRDIAAEVNQLREEIRDGLEGGMEPRFEELRASFADLKQMIGERAGADRIGAEIFEIMESLTELTAGTADQASIDALKAELDGVAAMVGQLAREETLDAVNRRWDSFEQRISDRVELDSKAQGELRAELERLRASLKGLATEEQILAVQARWDEFEARYLEDVRRETEATLTRFLRDELDGMRAKLDRLAEQTSGEALDERFEALAGRISTQAVEAGVERLSDRIAEIETALVSLPEILRLDEIEARIQILAESVDAVAGEARRGDEEQFASIETRLDEMSAAIIAAANPILDIEPLERIERRVESLAARVDRFTEGGDTELLSVQIAALTDRIEEMGQVTGFNAITARIDGLADRVEALFRSAHASFDASAMEERLTQLARRLDESAASRGADNEAIQALEAQIRRLAEHVGGGAVTVGEMPGGVGERLAAIERQLDENRDNVIVAARTAAEEAVRRMQGEDMLRETGHVRDLAQDLRTLEALHRDSDERNFGVFDAVHTTLLKIVERLTTIEREIRGGEGSRPADDAADAERVEWAAARIEAGTREGETPTGLRATLSRHLARRSPKDAAAAPVPETRAAAPVADMPFVPDAPALDASETVLAREMNRPLEPGSGAPNIAALIERVRQQQRGEEPAEAVSAPGELVGKADFIAAARKAAMAAAAEAEALRDRPDEGRDPRSTKGGAARRRKPILMAVGAVLLALVAIPSGLAFLRAGDEEVAARPAAVESTIQTAMSSAAPLALETSAPALPQPAIEAAPAPVPPPVAAIEPAAQPLPEAAAPDIAQAPETPAPLPSAELPAAAATAPAGPQDTSTLLAQATSRLPEAARGELPAMPEAVGTPALAEAVRGGDAMALFEVGLRIMEGRSGAADPAVALTWFAQSASRGFAPAQYSLGTLFEKGNGVERDTVAARDWYELAAGQGNVRAMHNLAVLFATGVDGVSDPARAAEWFLQAAEHGMRDSQYNLGILYARGAGVEQSLGDSYRWFQIVGKGGDRDAQSKMEEVGKTLLPEERARIDAAVAAWTPKPRVESANTVDVPAAWSEAAPQRSAAVDMTRAIRNVQAILIKLGYDPGKPDGIAGAQTETAIRQFQEKSGLEATGRIDETLIRALLERKDA